MKPMTLILIGTVIFLIGTAISTFGNLKARSNAQDKLVELKSSSDSLNTKADLQTEEIQRLRGENSKLQETINVLNEQSSNQLSEVKELRKENKQLRNDLANASKELASQITGGDSYCYLAARVNQGKPDFNLVSEGNYPLYDLGVRIVDLDKFEINTQKQNLTYQEFLKDDVIFNFETQSPKTARPLGNLGLSIDKEYKRYNIFYSARNGFFTQLLRMKLVDGVWKVATKVQKNDKNETMYERIDEGFPEEDLNWK